MKNISLIKAETKQKKESVYQVYSSLYALLYSTTSLWNVYMSLCFSERSKLTNSKDFDDA